MAVNWGQPGKHSLMFRDIFDIAVRWRHVRANLRGRVSGCDDFRAALLCYLVVPSAPFHPNPHPTPLRHTLPPSPKPNERPFCPVPVPLQMLSSLVFLRFRSRWTQVCD
jgi:hypothetical protein